MAAEIDRFAMSCESSTAPFVQSPFVARPAAQPQFDMRMRYLTQFPAHCRLLVTAFAVALLASGCRDRPVDAITELESLGARIEGSKGGPYTVDIRGKPAFTDEKIDLVARLPHVSNVTMENVPITDAGLERLRPAADLRRLILNESDVTGQGLRTLAALPLRRGLSSIGLRGLSISDSDVVALKEFSNLRRIDLSGTKITDAALRHLAGMKLDALNVKQTKVSEQAAAQFQESSPGLTVTR